VSAKRIAGNIAALILSGLALFLEMWTVVPAPDLRTLAVAVILPELAPWALAISLALLALVQWLANGWARAFATAFTAVAVGFAIVPLALEPATLAACDREMRMALGPDYAVAASDRERAQLVAAPFDLAMTLRGYPTDHRVHTMLNLPVISADGTHHALDLYRAAGPGPHPAVVVIYGGAWIFGSRADSAELARALASAGYTAIAIDYRKAPKYPFPTQIEDVQAAIATIAQNARAWQIDPARVAILGRSAGAELALLAAYAPEPLTIKAAIGYYTPVDLIRGWNDPPQPDPANVRRILRAYLGGSLEERPDAYAAASPIAHIRPGLPPTLLIGGGRDELVQLALQREMRDALRLHGVRTASLEIPWSNHAFDEIPAGLGGQIARAFSGRDPVARPAPSAGFRRLIKKRAA
jgi:acetyl esterase/lipase